MNEHMKKPKGAGHESAREQYELEHLTRKYGLMSRLARPGVAAERQGLGEADGYLEQPRKSGTHG